MYAMWGAVAVIGSPPLAFVLANATSNTTGEFSYSSLIGTVVTPAIVIILLLLGKLRTEPEVRRLEEDNKALKQQVQEKDAQMLSLQSGLVDKAIPALTRSTLVLETLSPILQTEVHLRRPPDLGGSG